MKIKDFTIIIPCITFKDVRECLENIRKNYGTVKIIVSLNKFQKKNTDKNTRFIVSKYKGIGKKRNLAVNASKTKYLAFVDSDAYPKKDWLESTFKLLKKKNVGIVAGPHIDPPNQNYTQVIIGLVKKSFLITMVPKFQKYEIKNKENKKPRFFKFLPSVNWIMTKKLFNSLNQMDEKMLRNEDWDFYHKMTKTKNKLLYSPNTIVYHDNGSINHFVRKRFLYGFHMWPILTKLNILNYYFFLPLFFAIFLISFPISLFLNYYDIINEYVHQKWEFIYFSVLAVYLAIVLFEATRLAKNLVTFIIMLPLLVIANVVPGFGILFGTYNYLKKK